MFALWACNKRTQFRCAISRQFVFPLHVIAYIFMINPVVTQGCRSLGGQGVPVVSRSFYPTYLNQGADYAHTAIPYREITG